MVTVETNEGIPGWLQRAAEICDAAEAELALANLLRLKVAGWPQSLALGADGRPIRDREFDQLRPEMERASMRLRQASGPIEIHAALRSIPFPILRGLRACAEAGTVPACLIATTKE